VDDSEYLKVLIAAGRSAGEQPQEAIDNALEVIARLYADMWSASNDGGE